MDRFRRRKPRSRVSSPVHVTTIVEQGSQVVEKQNRLSNSGSHSQTCSSIAFSEENRLVFDLGRNSGEVLTGTTMKKLLADEMSKETESGRRSPSIIARLMGLDGLPIPHNTNKKQKRQCDSHQRGSGSAGFAKNSKIHDSRTHRKNIVGQQQFKDVYEVVDRSNMETRSNTSHAASNQNSSEDDIGFIRRKFMDVKRFSTDEKLQHSKEYHDALDVLDSNKGLLLRYFQEPDSLFSKHLHDLHDSPASYNGCVMGMSSKNALKCNIDVIGCQTSGEVSQKIDIRHSHRRSSSTSCHCNMYNIHSTEMRKLRFSGGKEDPSSNPTKIVVLKPNLGKSLNISKSAPSTSPYDPQSNFRLYNECSNLNHLGPEVRGKGSKQDDFDIYGRKSRESRELAREITCRMRNKLGVESFNVSSSGCNGYKGYSADESSHDTSENDSSDELEVTIVSSRTSSNRTARRKASSLRYMESSVNVEAKKRLSERWKMTHRSQEHVASSKGSTLADMLAIPDVDIRPRSPDIVDPRDESLRASGWNDRTAKVTAPLGISSRDGWKDGCVQNLSKSRSLPASANHLGSPKSNARYEAITPERFLIQSIDHSRNKAMKRNTRRKHVSFSESRKPTDEKLESCDVRVEMVDDIYEMESSGNMMKNTTNGKDSPEVKSVILEIPSCRHDSSLAFNAPVEKENNHVYDGQTTASEITPCNLPEDGSSTSDVPSLPQVGGSSCLQCAATHAESSASSKESEQPSPVSVLEAPFVEDLSSGSECFERVSAELHGLRKQLQLLKLESEVYDDEVSVAASSDECEEDSAELHDGKNFPRVGGCWESWYLVDVLTLSGLDKTDCEAFLGTWHSPDCPIDPWVFEELEKKYGELESCSKTERRLLFEHINARIVEICEQFVDLEPWVNTPRKNISPQWLKDVLKTELHKLLEKHENKVEDNGMDMMILSDMRWMKLGEHISSVGRDIQALLIDELIAESLTV